MVQIAISEDGLSFIDEVIVCKEEDTFMGLGDSAFTEVVSEDQLAFEL